MWLAIAKAVLPSLLSGLEPFYRDYINGKISKAQLEVEGSKVLLESFTQLEQSLQDNLSKTYSSFMTALAQSPEMKRAWSVVLYSQLFVLLWHQFAIPFFVTFGVVEKYASSGVTVNWAYALIALCLGAPGIASRIGAGASWAADNLSRIIKK